MFSFKQFTIHQNNCAMKVCTDACLFGAWTASLLKEKQIGRILDIGTGTGLLSLMLAQQIPANVDAIEIDEAASIQASENFSDSPWSEKLQVIHTDFADFTSTNLYDLIITNPPFFEADLRSDDQRKNAAKHDTTLLLQDLIAALPPILTENGVAAILIPYHRTAFLEKIIADNHLHITHRTFVRQSTKHSFFRTMFLLSKQKGKMIEEEIGIKDEQNEYGDKFFDLLKDYYLKL